MPLLQSLESLSRPATLVACAALVMAVGSVDYVTGNEIAFSLFYLLPITWAAWRAGFGWGLGISVVSSVVWLLADAASGARYSHVLIPIWNTLIRLSFFVIVSVLLTQLTKVIERERQLARIDALTGAVNARHFYECCDLEIDRSQRYGRVFTLLYIDLDGFKRINDEHGHAAGDRALQLLADVTRKHIRAADVLGRMGGDEFVVLMPETDLDAAMVVADKLLALGADVMRQQGWQATLSMGVLAWAQGMASTDALIGRADELMYQAKRAGKNRAVSGRA
jgi:diguanylate cyclase (GGDEF)-like protein